MKKFIAVSAAALLLVLFGLVQPAYAEGEDLTPGQKFNGEVICLPDSYLNSTDGCELYGPAAYFAELAKEGVTYPAPPLPIIKPSPALNEIPFQYVKILSSVAPYYSSIGDADVKVPMAYIAGKGYISYQATQETEKGFYYQSNVYGFWVDGGDVARASVPDFQGLQFKSTPRTAFAWVVSPSVPATRTTPGYDGKETKHLLQRFEVVPVYAIKKVVDTDWIMIGLDEWVEDSALARVTPNTLPPAGVENGRWIEINLAEQTLMVYDNSQLVFATMVSTGIDSFPTKPGLFKIFEKKDRETMSGDFSGDGSGYYYLEDVPWTMYFDELRALHGAYWHAFYGINQSHGCVNLSIGDSRWLYDWGKVGDYVYVWDPTGKTPTDPAFYTAGGA
jgi:hypothetical protein